MACEIAVVGVSALFPGAADNGRFWSNILEGKDCVSDVPSTHWLIEDYYHSDINMPDHTYAKRGCFLSEVDFEPIKWGILPNSLEATDTAQLLALMVAQRTLEDALSLQFKNVDHKRTSIILGATSAQELQLSMAGRLQIPVWKKMLLSQGFPRDQVEVVVKKMQEQYPKWQEATFPGLLGNVVAGRIANRLNFGAMNCVTDAACASSFSALALAVDELLLCHSDLVLTGGVDTMNDIFMFMCFSKTPALSLSGDCRPFSDQADGTLLGEGLCMFALKRLDDAVLQGDHIYGVIKGIGSSSDGKAKSVYAPLPEGQARALRMAYLEAQYSPNTVGLVEAHGTGTKAGDAAEFASLMDVFSEENTSPNHCALGSIKSQIGHTKAAAGAAGLCKILFALNHRALPPTIKIDKPNPKLDIENSPFYLNTKAKPWIKNPNFPRRASVSAFGFGGSNFHLTVEESPKSKKPRRLPIFKTKILFLSDLMIEGLCRQLELIKRSLQQHGAFEWLCYNSATNYDFEAPIRLCILSQSALDLEKKLASAFDFVRELPLYSQSEQSIPRCFSENGIYLGVGELSPAHKTAFIFPGQGSQYLTMGNDLALAFDACIDAWDEANSELFAVCPDALLSDIVFPPRSFDIEKQKAQRDLLRDTEWAQPALAAACSAKIAILRQLGIKADAYAGHSFGELCALHAAGVLSRKDLFLCARKRGELMSKASKGEGAMLAVLIGLGSDDKWRLVEQLANECGVSVANFNSARQRIYSGTISSIDKLKSKLEQNRISNSKLDVSSAFHSELVKDAAQLFARFLQETIEMQKPVKPVYSGQTGEIYPDNPELFPIFLGNQIANPIQFAQQIENMYNAGCRVFVEVGPKNVLSKLIQDNLVDREHVVISLDQAEKSGTDMLFFGLAQMVQLGLAMEPSNLWHGYQIPVRPEQLSENSHSVKISGANYLRGYPGTSLGKISLNEEKLLVVEAIRSVPEKVNSLDNSSNEEIYMSSYNLDENSSSKNETKSEAKVSRIVRSEVEAWVGAFTESQKQTAQVQADFQRLMAEAHLAYLRNSEMGIKGLATLAENLKQTANSSIAFTNEKVKEDDNNILTVNLKSPAVNFSDVQDALKADEEDASSLDVNATKRQGATQEENKQANKSSYLASTELVDLLLSVVSEKTGYPKEMIDLDMDIESELGIDSIKRVEIMSTFSELAPTSLQATDSDRLAQMQTLRQVVELYEPDTHSAYNVSEKNKSDDKKMPMRDEILKVALEVVSEKTGYPKELIGLDMDMESELGIDSIKRVEILSGLSERLPNLPDVDPALLSALPSIGEIISFYDSQYVSDSVPVATYGEKKSLRI